ncbi:helix-turn-helix domain-containing protein [Streptomyces sp. TLI_105]|uniref:helix-turn-helix domain-containing protein n=1 Tax=Streptomyces sp. TLI_105 TaxID=1881019 RepID=UPI000898A114|nr:helix-turn-helix domain-containing protein [Streptomyces sp. TLI_105]SED33858.1 Sugar diacid utilization regulator [Streptomyces sp. TLI_105]
MTVHGADGAGGADALLTVLELLARQAPPAHFDTLLDEARRTGLAGEELHRLERAVDLAGAVHTGRARDARREAGLAALTDTARDLTLSYDLDSLLRVVIRRARRLLGLDLAYVTLRGPHGASYVHTSEGSRPATGPGARLTPGLRIAEGYGLGGAVQLHGGPVWTADYLADERFAPSGSLDAGVHAPAFDEAAESALRAEGVHAIVAAPLRSGDTVVGALYGADRRVRHHTPEEIGLLAGLADLAALAVEKAGLLDRTRAEVSELERDSSRVRTSLARMRHVSEAHGRIMNLVLAGGDLCHVAKAAADALDATVLIRDPGGRPLASAGDIPGLDEEAVAKASLDAHARRRPVLTDDDTWVAPVIAGSEDLGGLVIRAAGGLTGEDERLLELAAQCVAFLLLMRRSTAVAEGPVRDELLDDLIADPPHAPQQIAQRARRLGVDLRRPHVLVLARPEGGEQGRAVVWASSYAYRLSGLKTVQGGCIVLLLPGIDASAAAQAVAAELSPLLGHPVSVAAAGPAQSPDGVGRIHQEAHRCLDAMSALGGTGSAASVQDLGFLGLLLSDDNDVDGFVESAIGPVLDYDAERFTDLTHTLEAYFASGGSPSIAAEALHVHPNTVSRRLERIGELLGPEWQKPGQVLEVQLALRLQRTREVLARGRATADPARQPGPPERGA